jgi:hypothetical protein
MKLAMLLELSFFNQFGSMLFSPLQLSVSVIAVRGR